MRSSVDTHCTIPLGPARTSSNPNCVMTACSAKVLLSLTLPLSICCVCNCASGLDDSECRRYMNRLSKDNVAQLFIFEALTRNSSGSEMNSSRQARQMNTVCVVNTHLYSNHTR